MPQERLSVHDIARLSGVSRSTVSRVINNHPNVKESTRRRVMEVVERYNYRPDPAARALVNQQTHVLGVLIPHVISDLFSDPFFPSLLQGITTTANQYDYSVTLWLTTTESNEAEFYQRVGAHRMSDGLIVASAIADDPFLDTLSESGKPYIIVGRPESKADDVSFVDAESEKGSYQVVTHLLARGRRRIAFIPGWNRLASARDRQNGYERALRDAGVAFTPDLIGAPGNYHEEESYRSMKNLLAKDLAIDALYAASDVTARGAMRAIREASLRIPDDIAVAGFDDMPFSANTDPPLTTVRQPIQAMAASAVRGIITLIEDPQVEVYRDILPVDLIVRESS